MNRYNFKVLLSASVPSKKRSERFNEEYNKIKNAQIQIDEAVIALSRNVFQAGGKLIFGGHPSISPLVAMVATEFKLNKEIENSSRNEAREKPITIFQSKAYENASQESSSGLFELGYTNIVWTDSVNGEKYNPNIQDKAQCEKSLLFMRKQMMQENIDALVCMGGMEGVEQEFELFRDEYPRKPVFLLKTTGGATNIIANKFTNKSYVNVIDNIEYEKSFLEQLKGQKSEYPEIFDIIPFSFITALIVQQILDMKH
jgi:hypothetical protein